MTAGREFWEFSLAVYSRPGVPDECLALQEQLGLDVNLLLLCAYLGARREALLRADQIAAAVKASAGWHNDAVRSLRAARKALKPWSKGRDADLTESARSLRNAVKKLELDAERIEHDLLARWVDGLEFEMAPAEAAIRSNVDALLAYCSEQGAKASAPPRQFIAAALEQSSRPNSH